MAISEDSAATAAPSRMKDPGHHRRRLLRNPWSKVAAIPMILTALGVFVGGTLWTVLHSFSSSRLLPKFDLVERWRAGEFFDQYERLFSARRWDFSVDNLIVYGLVSIFFTLFVGFMLAALLDRKIRGEDAFRTIFLYPFALSFIVTGLAWQWILNPELGLPEIVRALGWESFAFDPLYTRGSSIWNLGLFELRVNHVMFGLLIAGLWQGTGLIMCIMLAGLRGIDEDIWKAARVDGIPVWKTYLRVVIPMMRPVFVTSLVLITSGIVKLYDLVVAMTSGGPGLNSEVPAKYVYDTLFLRQNLGQGFAASTMMLVTVAVILIPWAYLEFGGKKRG